MNVDNKELLDWACENVPAWNNKYKAMYWFVDDAKYWVTPNIHDDLTGLDGKPANIQVVTKEEWLEARTAWLTSQKENKAELAVPSTEVYPKLSNEELLDWAVKNIDTWGSSFNFLRGDTRKQSVFYTTESGIVSEKGHWLGMDISVRASESLGVASFTHAQVITKKEWHVAKNRASKPYIVPTTKNDFQLMADYANKLLAGESVDDLEYLDSTGTWVPSTSICPNFLSVSGCGRYRWKPKRFDAIAPMKSISAKDARGIPMVYVLCSTSLCGFRKCKNTFPSLNAYNNGYVFATAEDAEIAVNDIRAILKPTILE